MTIANSFAAKASVAFVAVAMALSMVSPAQAQTAEELQAQIDTLMATIASLQSQTGATATVSGDAYVFTRSLTIGSEGADVTALQTYLISAGFSIPAGATGYFGAQTQAAVAAWQSANGVMPAAGYFGPVSTAKYNALMAATPTTPTDDTDDSDDSDDSDSESDELGEGEASLEGFSGSDGDDTELEEGQEAAPVAEFEFDVEDGDVEINRVDVAFDADAGNGEDEPWEHFDEISLWVDGDEIASEDVSDEDDWMDDDPYAGAHTFRFTGLDTIFRDGETAQIIVAVTVAGSVDNVPETWEVFIPEEGIRAVDGEGIDQYIGEDDSANNGTLSEQVSFDIDEEGGDDELTIKSSDSDPDATTLQVEDDATSDWMTVFAFDMDTDDSVNDIEVNTIVVQVDTATADYEDVVNDAMLVIDGEEYDDVTVTNGASNTATLTFDIDGDLVIDAGDEITAELQLEFKKLDGTNYSAGETVTGSIPNETGWDAEGADDLDLGTQLDGAASGETHTLRTTGAVVETTEVSETLKANTDTTLDDDEGVFEIEFDVTAFESDLYIDDSTERGTANGTAGVNYTLTVGGTATTAGTAVATLDADTDLEGGFFVVDEGETVTFTLTVEYDPAITESYKLQLVSVNFAETGVAPTAWQDVSPASDFDTDSLTI